MRIKTAADCGQRHMDSKGRADMKTRLAIYDLDGTLFNTSDVNYHAYNQALEEQGYSMDYELYCRKYNGRHYKVFLPEILYGEEELIEAVHRRKIALYHQFLDKARPNHHLIRMMKCMKQEYYLAMVTTASKSNTIEIVRQFDILEDFDLIITQEDVEHTKPHPEGFQKAMGFFGLKPEDTVIFEDSEVGLEAAGASGASVIRIVDF